MMVNGLETLIGFKSLDAESATSRVVKTGMIAARAAARLGSERGIGRKTLPLKNKERPGSLLIPTLIVFGLRVHDLLDLFAGFPNAFFRFVDHCFRACFCFVSDRLCSVDGLVGHRLGAFLGLVGSGHGFVFYPPGRVGYRIA